MQPALLEQHLVPIQALRAHPRNYKQHPEAQLAKIRASLKRFGQPKPVLVYREQDTVGRPISSQLIIIAGHGVTEAASQLGWTVDIFFSVMTLL